MEEIGVAWNAQFKILAQCVPPPPNYSRYHNSMYSNKTSCKKLNGISIQLYVTEL